jgi:hypothetical protein
MLWEVAMTLDLSPIQIALGTGGFTALALTFGTFLGRQLTTFTVNRLEANHKSELNQVEATHKSELNKWESTHKSELTRMEATHAGVLSRLAADHQSELTRLEDRFRSRLRQIEETHSSDLRRLEESSRSSLELARVIDTDLRVRRIASYQEIWQGTSLLPKWPPAELNFAQLLEFSAALRDWYFSGGGMYLSLNASAVYRDLQNAIWKLHPDTRSGPLKLEEYESVRSACSALRTELTIDIESRRPAPLVENPSETKQSATAGP